MRIHSAAVLCMVLTPFFNELLRETGITEAEERVESVKQLRESV